MGRITSLNDALMANRVYQIDAGDYGVTGYDATLFEGGLSWAATNTDFEGRAYVKRSLAKVVVAFQGTVPKKAGDLVADMKIAIGGLVGMLF